MPTTTTMPTAMAWHQPNFSNLALILNEIEANKHVTSATGDEKPTAINQLQSPAPRPSSSVNKALSKKMDALNDTIKKLQLEQKSGPASDAKYLGKECKKYLKKGKRGKGPCRCPICLPSSSTPTAPSENQIDESLVKMLIDLCQKKQGLEISAPYAKGFLAEKNSKLLPALSAIVKDLDSRQLALNNAGRVSIERERPIAERGGRKTRDQFMTYMEDDDRDIRELGEHGWKSHYGRAVQRYKKPEKEKWFKMYTEEAAFRIERAIHYKEMIKHVHEGKMTAAELKSHMDEYDGLDEEVPSELGKGKCKEKVAPGESGRGKILADARKGQLPSQDPEAATVESDEDNEDDEQDDDLSDNGSGSSYDSDGWDSDISLETRVRIIAGPKATRAEIRKAREDMIAKYKARLAKLNHDYADQTCTDCKTSFNSQDQLQAHLDNLSVSCTGRGVTKAQEQERMRAEQATAKAELDKNPEARKAAIQAQLAQDMENCSGDVLTTVLITAVRELEDEPYKCDRCGGMIKTMTAVNAHLSKPQSSCNNFFKGLIGVKYFTKIDDCIDTEHDSPESSAIASTSGKNGKKGKTQPKKLSEPLLDIVRKLRIEAKEKFKDKLGAKVPGTGAAEEPPVVEKLEVTVTDAMGMTVPSFVDDTVGGKTMPSFVEATKNLHFNEGDPVPAEELEAALTLTPQMVELHQRLRNLWEEDGSVLVDTIEEDVLYNIEDVRFVIECCPFIYKASWARTLIGLCGGSACLAVQFTKQMIVEIETYFKKLGVLEVTLRGIEREANRFVAAVHYEYQFGTQYQPEVGHLVDLDFYFYLA